MRDATKSNDIWKKENNYDNWELRQYRFTEEMRDLYFNYLGINSSSQVLDAGCGTGVFTRYIAKGLQTGRIIGFDISQDLVHFGNARILEQGLSEQSHLVVEDGFNLSFKDESFDAVTNYTYLGVLTDPMNGLKEMIRVCKKGGTVSAAVASNLLPKVSWRGDYPFDFNDRLEQLNKRQEEIYNQLFINDNLYSQSREWHALRFPKLFDECGLKDIHIYPIAYGFSYNDQRFTLEERMKLIDQGLDDQIRILEARMVMKGFSEAGFSQGNFIELIDLLRKKQEYLNNNLLNDQSFEWSAGLNYIVTGIKQ
jgi:ubiquinone/menaquinone biosynthesis C-methylase UbiE